MSIDLEKIHKTLHRSTVEEMQAMSAEQLHTKIVEAHLEKMRAKNHLANDEEVQLAKERLKELTADAKETIKACDAIEDFGSHLLEEKGKA